jgi:ADP-ribose pyrophosphatase YjhB (NUDIX family)
MASAETAKLISSAVIVRDGRALVFEEKDDAGELKYNLPGGHVEPGETPIDALVREVSEETGMACEPVAFLQIVVNAWSRSHSALLCFSARVADDAAVTPEEGIVARWMTGEEIAALPDDRCIFGIKTALAKALGGETMPDDALALRKGGQPVDWLRPSARPAPGDTSKKAGA